MKLKQDTFIQAHSGEIMKSHFRQSRKWLFGCNKARYYKIKGVKDELVGATKIWEPMGETLYVPQGLLRIKKTASLTRLFF